MAAMISGYRVCTALLAATVLLLAGCGGSDDGGGSTSAATGASTATGSRPQLGAPLRSMTALPGVLKTVPPWPANNGRALQLRLRAIGLDPLRQEGQVVHIHQHLDVYANGDHVTIPAQIGIDANGGFISDLHTHDTSGIMHVESPTQRTFTLGQFFAVWGVQLSPSCIGGLCKTGDKRLHTWINGAPVTADPTRIVLEEHQEIVLAYGTQAQMPKPVPASFDFAAVGL